MTRRGLWLRAVPGIALLGALGWMLLPAFLPLSVVVHARRIEHVQECRYRLREIALHVRNLVNTRYEGRWPAAGGARLLLLPEADLESWGPRADRYRCPGTNDTDDISYAGRDLVRFPIAPGTEHEAILAADDNEFGPNHEGHLNVVYADGHVETWDQDDLAPYVEEDRGYVVVGPGSKHPELAKLGVD